MMPKFLKAEPNYKVSNIILTGRIFPYEGGISTLTGQSGSLRGVSKLAENEVLGDQHLCFSSLLIYLL